MNTQFSKQRTIIFLVILPLLVSIVSCVGTSARLNDVSLGMTKSEVIDAIGSPGSVTAEGSTEYLVYHWASPKQLIVDESNLDRYYVRLTSGVVDSYGEVGDLGTDADLGQK